MKWLCYSNSFTRKDPPKHRYKTNYRKCDNKDNNCRGFTLRAEISHIAAKNEL